MMEIYKNLTSFYIWNNSGSDYLIAILTFIVAVFILKIFKFYLLAKLEKIAQKTKNDFDDFLITLLKKIRPVFYNLVALYIAIKTLNLSFVFNSVVDGLFILIVVYQIIVVLQNIIEFWVDKITKNKEDGSKKQIAQSISLLSKIALWIFAILIILSNWGINITSLIAGLGIGGIAIALAVQKILSDIFSSFSIFIDKPFTIGDFIVVGPDMGVVKKIGIKTTRIKTLQGEELVIPNQELTSERVRNFKKMQERRVVFSIGVIYETPLEKIEKIPQIIKEVIEKVENVRFDRAHFKSFGDFSLNFEIVYYVKTNDYLTYMNAQQDINLQIMKKFQKEGIEFAYPTQLLYLQNLNNK